MTAYQRGTATDSKDLLSLLVTFLSTHTDLVNATPSQAWTVMRGDVSDEYEVILKGPGLAGTDEIYAGIQTYSSVGEDYYNWRLQGFTGFLAGNAFASQPGAIQDYPPCLALHDSNIPYCFVADGRRFIVVARISTVYEACYMGLLLPTGLPSQLPYPLVVGGSITGESGYRWSTQNVTHRQFVSPGALYGSEADEYRSYSTLRLLHGNWLSVRNYYGTSGEGSASWIYRQTWPYGDAYFNTVWAAMRDNIDGSFPCFPIQVYAEGPETNVFGELAGCLAIPGFSTAAEDIVQIGGVDHLVIPNVYRSGAADWWALRLE